MKYVLARVVVAAGVPDEAERVQALGVALVVLEADLAARLGGVVVLLLDVRDAGLLLDELVSGSCPRCRRTGRRRAWAPRAGRGEGRGGDMSCGHSSILDSHRWASYRRDIGCRLMRGSVVLAIAAVPPLARRRRVRRVRASRAAPPAAGPNAVEIVVRSRAAGRHRPRRRRRGRARRPPRVKLNPGPHRLRASMSGYYPAPETRIQVGASEPPRAHAHARRVALTRAA